MSKLSAGRFEELDYLYRSSERSRGVICLLHGYGANMHDLSELSQVMDPEGHWDWYFPNGLLPVEFSGQVYGRCWFPITQRDFEALQNTGPKLSWADYEPPFMNQSASVLKRFVQDVMKDRGSLKLVLGGFSQGAMMATQLSFELKQSIEGLILFSGSLTNRPHLNQLTALQSARSQIRFFQSHGVQDPVLPMSGAISLHQYLSRDGRFSGDLVQFDGGHEIPFTIIRKATEFLSHL